MYVAVVPNRGSPPAILLRESYREAGKTKNRTLANLSRWPAERIEQLRAVLRGDKLLLAALGTARRIALDAVLPRRAPQRRGPSAPPSTSYRQGEPDKSSWDREQGGSQPPLRTVDCRVPGRDHQSRRDSTEPGSTRLDRALCLLSPWREPVRPGAADHHSEPGAHLTGNPYQARHLRVDQR